MSIDTERFTIDLQKYDTTNKSIHRSYINFFRYPKILFESFGINWSSQRKQGGGGGSKADHSYSILIFFKKALLADRIV